MISTCVKFRHYNFSLLCDLNTEFNKYDKKKIITFMFMGSQILYPTK